MSDAPVPAVTIEDEADKSALLEQSLDHTQAIRKRMTSGLVALFDDIMRDFHNPATGEKAKRPTDVEEFEKLTKLALKTMSDSDKVDLTRLKLETDKGINNSNIEAARERATILLKEIGQMSAHPGAVSTTGRVIEGEVVEVSEAERDKRLGFDMLDDFNSVEFDAGMLIKGRVEENSDAFYARLNQTLDSVSQQVEASENGS